MKQNQEHLVEYIRCIVCHVIFPRMKAKRVKNGNPVGVRGFGFKTCSRKCSKAYQKKRALKEFG